MVWIDGKTGTVLPGFRWKFSALGRRIVASMLVVTFVLSALITAAQIWAEQKKEVAQARADIVALHRFATRSSLDEDGLHVLLDSLQAMPLVAGIAVYPHKSDAAASIALPLPASLNAEWVLVETAPPALKGLFLDRGQQFFVSNLLIVLICGMIMMVIFDRLAALHLKNIAAKVRSSHWMTPDSPVSFDKDPAIFPDEIGTIVDTLEDMRKQALNAYSSLTEKAQDMRSLNANLKDLNREQTELAHALSHDLVAPINSLEMLLVEIGVFSPAISSEALQTLCDLQTSAARIRSQIASVQSYATLLKEDFPRENVDADQVLEQVVEIMRPAFDHAGASLVIEPLGSVFGHSGWFSELLSQLLTNAVLFRDPARALTIRIAQTQQSNSNMLEFEISDTGSGIAPEHHEAVFGLFRRLHAHEDTPGNGMGLPMARRIVQRHSGHFSLTSEPGVRTTLTISLPRSCE